MGSVSLMSQELWSPGSRDTDGLKGIYTHWNAGFSLVLKWEPQPPNRIKVLCYSRPQNIVLSLLRYLFMFPWASLTAQLVKNPPAMQETLVQVLGQEDPLEKEWATHSSILRLPLWLSW